MDLFSKYKYQLLSFIPVILCLIIYILNPVNYYWDDLMLMDAARSVASGSLWASFDPSLQMSSDLSELESRLMIHWAPLKAIILGLFLAIGFSEVAASLTLWTIAFTAISYFWSKIVSSFHVSSWDSVILVIGFPLLIAPTIHPWSTEILAMAIFMIWLYVIFDMIRGYPPEIIAVIILSILAGLAFWARYSVLFLLPLTVLVLLYVGWSQKILWGERFRLLIAAFIPGFVLVVLLLLINKSAAGTSSFIEEFGFSNLHWGNLKTLDPFSLLWINASGSGMIRDFLSTILNGRIFGVQIYTLWQFLSIGILLLLTVAGIWQERSRNVTLFFVALFACLYGILALSSLTTPQLGHFTFFSPHRFYVYAYPALWLVMLALLKFSAYKSVQAIVIFSIIGLFLAAPERYLSHQNNVETQSTTYLQHEDIARHNIHQIQQELSTNPPTGDVIILAADMMQAPHLLKHGDFPVLISLPEEPYATNPVTIFLVGSADVRYRPGSYYYIFPVIREDGIRDLEQFGELERVYGDVWRVEVQL